MLNFSKMMEIFDKIANVKNTIKTLKLEGKTIALVPTMGSLHQGHLSLIKEAKKQAHIVIVSIFVNKKQFDNQHDFNNYPSNLKEDIKKLEDFKVDILFAPLAEEIYPNQQQIKLDIDKLGDNLCGKSRKNHFQGVLLIVSKLFNIIDPDNNEYKSLITKLTELRLMNIHCRIDTLVVGDKVIDVPFDYLLTCVDRKVLSSISEHVGKYEDSIKGILTSF